MGNGVDRLGSRYGPYRSATVPLGSDHPWETSMAEASDSFAGPSGPSSIYLTTRQRNTA